MVHYTWEIENYLRIVVVEQIALKKKSYIEEKNTRWRRNSLELSQHISRKN